MSESPPPPSEEEIARIEERFRVRFPVEYRAFLLRYNGGRAVADLPASGEEDTFDCDLVFFSVGAADRNRDLERAIEFHWGMGVPERLMPVASTDIEQMLYLAVAGEDRGRVVSIFDGLEAHEWNDPPAEPVADSFADLLLRLRPAGEA